MAKRFAILFLTLALVAFLVISAGAKVKLTTWAPYGGAPGELWERCVQEFNKTHPDMELEYVFVAWDGFFQKLATASLSGTAPEFAHVWGSGRALSLAEMGVVLSLDDFLAVDKTVSKGDFYPGMWENFVWGGKIWGFPDSGQVAMLYWNKDMFAEHGLDPDKAPSYFEEVSDYVGKMFKTDATGRLINIGFLPLEIWGGFFNYGYLWGGNFYDPDTHKITAADPVNVEALQWAVDYYNKYGGVEAINNFVQGFKGLGQGDSPWLKGKQGMIMGHQYVLTFTDRYAPDLNYGIGPPLVSKGPGNKGPLPGTDANIMIKGSKHPEEGWEAFKWWVIGEGSMIRWTEWNTASGSTTINKKLVGKLHGYWERPGMWDMFNKVMSTSRPWPSTPVMSFYQDRMGAEVDFALRGKKTAREALMEVQRMTQAELDKKLKK